MDRKLADYLPPVLSGIRELAAVMDAEQPEAEALWAAMKTVLDAGFVETADSRGLARWERMLGIRPKGRDTLEIRRTRIIARLNERLPYTLLALKRMLTAICGADGYTVKLECTAYYLRVRVAVNRLECMEEVQRLLDRVVPANMVTAVEPDYNTHEDLGRYTHRQLGTYTHRELREKITLKGGNG